MSDPFADRPMPRAPLAGAVALVVLTLAAVAFVRLTGVGAESPPLAATVSERELRFADRPEGGVAVHDARDGALVAVLAPGGDGFVRGTLRALARERRSHGIGAGPPFRLAAHADGRLTLEDLATDRRIDLAAFGPTNAGAFARFLERPARISLKE
jgi:putative photosynthetic complex assembly protein